MPAYLQSELPVVDKARHHWIVLFRAPGWVLGGMLAVLFIASIISPWPAFGVLAVTVGIVGFLRWQTWHAESIILTRRRIIRVSGVPETTSTEASLRLDRVSGAVMEQTVLGKMLDYGTLELEAPGDHPDVRILQRISHPTRFYMNIRELIFADTLPQDPNDVGADYITEPLPDLDEDGDADGSGGSGQPDGDGDQPARRGTRRPRRSRFGRSVGGRGRGGRPR